MEDPRKRNFRRGRSTNCWPGNAINRFSEGGSVDRETSTHFASASGSLQTNGQSKPTQGQAFCKLPAGSAWSRLLRPLLSLSYVWLRHNLMLHVRNSMVRVSRYRKIIRQSAAPRCRILFGLRGVRPCAASSIRESRIAGYPLPERSAQLSPP